MNVYNQVAQFGWYGLEGGAARQGNHDGWFVDSNSGNAGNISTGGQGGSWELPFSTLNYAISQASAGDFIFIAAGHAESIADTGTASGTVTDELVIDKTALTIIGMGSGDRRPKFTLGGATDAAMVVLAAEATIKNLVFESNLADVAAAIAIGALGDGFVIENCEFYDGGASEELVIGISVAANADNGTIRGCKFYTTNAGSSTASGIKLVGASIRTQIHDNIFRGDWNTAAIYGVTAAAADILVKDNIINNFDVAAGLCISLHANSTGTIDRNTVLGGLAGTRPIAAGNCLLGDNKITTLVGVEGGGNNDNRGTVSKSYTNWTEAKHTLFNIVGGPVIVTGLVGVVTATIKSASIDINLDLTPTAPGTDVVLGTVLVIDGDAVGTTYTMNGTFGGVLIATTVGGLEHVADNQFIAPVGDITMECSGGQAEDGGGTILWGLSYTSLVPGAYVQAAATD